MTTTRSRSLLFGALALLVLAAAAVTAQALSPSHAGAGADHEAVARPAVEAVLAPGAYVQLPDGTRLTLSHVTDDSRCPVDVICVWPGEVTSAFTLATGDAERAFTITFDGSTPASAGAGNYRVTVLDVQPLPVSGEPIESDGYRVTVTLARR